MHILPVMCNEVMVDKTFEENLSKLNLKQFSFANADHKILQLGEK